MEKPKSEQLAATLDWLVKEGHIPGILPEKVTEAAALLRAQEEELQTLRKALATKEHIVEATAEEYDGYRTKVRATFVITDPRLYYGEMVIDDRWKMGGAPSNDWELHLARQLVSAGTAEWVRELQEKAYIAIHKAIAGETRRAETTGSVAQR